ncbi:hypothetical protein HO133_000548 [Letharia lupina]|uniref:Uncharacterized protein n=1 Tax=Letharia lupina TaxID=560253 RepID=A0A8H6CI08_9LECA|nr:uncharacterized protein HO133_000548 [Letharia lupina]KAF6223705.1 hypothetical protein HO133_000548 [Letharia lupina]
MAGQSLIKRPVVLGLAGLQNNPTLTDGYAETLPFDDGAAGCECPWEPAYWSVGCRGCAARISFSGMKAKCIKRTRERWTWFSSARRIDDKCGERLGTLIYLPWEIRQKILKVLFEDHANYYRSELITKESSARSIYPRYWGDHKSRFYGMRLASPSTKVELEHYYLTQTEFRFESPKALENFLDRVSIYQQSLLRSFTFKLCRTVYRLADTSAASDWVAVCARLPPNLVSVQFDILGQGLRGIKTGGQCFIYDDDYPTVYVHRAITLVEILGKRARRCAAGVKVDLLDCEFDPKHVVQEGGIEVSWLIELEPWSKNWLGWWEEATKIDFDDGEGARNVA